MTDPLGAERAAAQAQIEALTREFDSVVAASQSSNADDEHDPEGATIATTTSSAPAPAMVRRKCGSVSIRPTSGSTSEGSWYSQPGWCSSDPPWWSTV